MALQGSRHALTRQVRAATDESRPSAAQPALPAPGGGAAARAPARPASSALAPQAPAPGPPSSRPRPPRSGRGPPARELRSSHVVPQILVWPRLPLPQSHAQQAPRGSPVARVLPGKRPSLWRRGACRRPLRGGGAARKWFPPRSRLPAAGGTDRRTMLRPDRSPSPREQCAGFEEP